MGPWKNTEIHKFSIFNKISSVNIKCGNDFKTKGVIYIHNKFVNEPKISKVVQVYIGLKHVTIWKYVQTILVSPWETLSYWMFPFSIWKVFRPLTSHHMKSFQTGTVFEKLSYHLPVTTWKAFKWWPFRWWWSDRNYQPHDMGRRRGAVETRSAHSLLGTFYISVWPK